MTLIHIKLIHTAIWVFFVICIIGIPAAALFDRYNIAIWLSAIVLLEVAVLLLNKRTCPLTTIASQYTQDRRANFDIYLPLWLARHNKTIFGFLYLAGIIFAISRWYAVA